MIRATADIAIYIIAYTNLHTANAESADIWVCLTRSYVEQILGSKAELGKAGQHSSEDHRY
jgi:hypothetical protein